MRYSPDMAQDMINDPELALRVFEAIPVSPGVPTEPGIEGQQFRSEDRATLWVFVFGQWHTYDLATEGTR
jgi:hypothetical protein